MQTLEKFQDESEQIKQARVRSEYVLMNSPIGWVLTNANTAEIECQGTKEECFDWLRMQDPGYYHGIVFTDSETELLWKGRKLD